MMNEQIKSVPTLATLRAHRAQIIAISQKYGAFNVRVFGSVARGDANAGSDIDLLVNFQPGFTLLKLSGLVRSLRELLNYPVEVASADHLRDEMRDAILQDAKPL
jgi:predicted nucleotidyltransferase